MFVGQLFEHALRCGIASLRLLDRGKPQFFKQDDLQLFGRAHQKLFAREFMNFLFQGCQRGLVLFGEAREHRLVNSNAIAFNPRKYPGEWELDVDEQTRQPVSIQALLDLRPHRNDGRHVIGKPACEVFHWNFGGGRCFRAAPGKIFPTLD